MKKIKYVIILLVILLIGGGVYMTDSYAPEQIALDALESDTLMISNEDYISFIPESHHSTGIILYPGGKVDPEAYAPLMRDLALKGYPTFISKMPFNFAILSPNEADKIITEYDSIDSWCIIGHSLGGVMAAQYAYENDLDYLVLLASYPQDKHDLSEEDVKTLSIVGSLDGLMDQTKIDSKKHLLPDSTKYITIDGGNHAQMGYYGKQKNDLEATITTDDQQQIIFNAICDLIEPTLQ